MVSRCSNPWIFHYIFLSLLALRCESKVCNFSHAIVHEDIGDFEITVNNAFRGKIGKTTKNISHNSSDFFFWKILSPSFEKRLKITLVAELSNYVAVAIAAEDLKASQHIRMIKLFENLYFWMKEFF